MITKKTPEEIEILKEGGRRHSEMLNKIALMVSPGVSTLSLEEFARKLLKESGDTAAFLNYTPDGADRPYPAALCISINKEIVHGIPNEKPKILKEGDIVSLDLGLTHKGLITDMAITVGVGKISAEDKLLIKATREALDAGIGAAKFGNTIGDIGSAIEKVSKKYNLNLAEGLAGHGVGYDVHEDPYVPNSGIEGDGPRLVTGMVIAIEPMLVSGKGDIKLERDGYTVSTKDGGRAAHFEKTVLITDGLPTILTP
jgi:methionyl aminopeptidase